MYTFTLLNKYVFLSRRTPGVSPTGAEENESTEKGALAASNSNIDSSSSESIDGVDVHHKFPQSNHTIMPQVSTSIELASIPINFHIPIDSKIYLSRNRFHKSNLQFTKS